MTSPAAITDDLRAESLLFVHLQRIALRYSKICPNLGSFYGNQLLRSENARVALEQKLSGTVCMFCGTSWSADNYKGRIRPRIKPKKSIRQLQKKYHHQPWLLKRWQRRLTKLSLTQNNSLEIKCLYCRKTRHCRMLVPLQEDPNPQQNNPRKKKKAKRRKKDPSAGLSIPLRNISEDGEKPKTPIGKLKSAKAYRPLVSPSPIVQKTKPPSRTVHQLQQMLDKKNKKTGKSMKASLKDFLDSVSQ